jgi:hypothetical protein
MSCLPPGPLVMTAEIFVVQEGGERCLLGAELVGNLPRLRCCSVGIIRGERYGNEGGDDAPPKLLLFN